MNVRFEKLNYQNFGNKNVTLYAPNFRKKSLSENEETRKPVAISYGK